MNIQIFGFKNCQDTRKAQRFFAERRIPVHFVDLDERPAAKGELRRFAERFGPAALIDKEGARYKALGLRVALRLAAAPAGSRAHRAALAQDAAGSQRRQGDGGRRSR